VARVRHGCRPWESRKSFFQHCRGRGGGDIKAFKMLPSRQKCAHAWGIHIPSTRGKRVCARGYLSFLHFSRTKPFSTVMLARPERGGAVGTSKWLQMVLKTMFWLRLSSIRRLSKCFLRPKSVLMHGVFTYPRLVGNACVCADI
jgi:hypothetical protein